MSYYMLAKNIKGSVISKGHEGWIELHSLDFGLLNNVSVKIGRTNDRSNGFPNIGDFVITKPLDQASPYLLEASLSNACLGDIKIELCGNADNSGQYLQYTLNDVMLSHYDISGTSDKESNDKPIETLHLSFTKIEMKYTARDSSNRAKSPISAGYDLEKATKI